VDERPEIKGGAMTLEFLARLNARRAAIRAFQAGAGAR